MAGNEKGDERGLAPAPQPDPELTVGRFYHEAKNGRLLGLLCGSGHVTVPPRKSCRICGSLDLKVQELSGRARVISTTEVYSKSKDFPIDAPYLLALAQLEEGGNLLGIVESSQASGVGPGAKVRVKFEVVGSAEGSSPEGSENLSERGRPRIFFQLLE